MDTTPNQIPRYRCTACGNLTRFEVTTTRRTRAFHHYTIGGELTVEEPEVLHEEVESVVCRWCGTGASVVQIEPGPADEERPDGEVAEHAGTNSPPGRGATEG
jgi:hypothetical protein